MIVHKISVDTYLNIEDADVDGFTLTDTEEGRVWLSYEQLDDVAALLATVRKINAEPEGPAS